MTFDKLYKAHEAAGYPDAQVDDYLPDKFVVWTLDGGANILTETEAALLCARLLAILPAATASEAVALSESIRRDANETADA